MIRLVSLMLSATMLLQGMHLSFQDVVQLDELIEHARYHKEQFGDSFSSFLAKHYGDQKQEHHQQHQEEQDQHEGLPFQQICAHIITLLPKSSLFELGHLNTDLQDTQNFYHPLGNTVSFNSGVFQPPRQG